MSYIHRRLKKAEDKLNINQEHITVNITCYGGGELPPDDVIGGLNIHYVRYSDKEKQ